MKLTALALRHFAAVALSATAACPAAAQQPASTAVSAAAPRAAAAHGPAITASLRRGEIDIVSLPDPHTGVQLARATVIVDAPAEVAMRIVTDYAHYSDFLPNFRASRVLSRRGNNAIVYLEARAVHNTTTIWAQLRIFQRRPAGQTQIIEGRMMQGNVARMDARWEVTPIDDGARSLVTFQFLIDPDLPFPDSIVSQENRRVTSRAVDALRRRATEPRFAVARSGR